ncbi:hypothetical protein [Xanthomonas arboricola]|uniref:hypothetical protein n=1 Tax=Xanthomonas arboricola TaxID=56448 RepID=UPI0015E475D0|nr:hypothetical protein [Xanthomonas arboricola]
MLKKMVHGCLTAALTAKDKNKGEAEGQVEDLKVRMLRFPGCRSDEVPDLINPDPGMLLPAYYKGLIVEFYGKESGYWIKPKEARNDPMDTAVYVIRASLAYAIKGRCDWICAGWVVALVQKRNRWISCTSASSL